MLGNDASVLADYDTVGVSMDLDRSSDGTGRDRVFVVVEAHQAGLRDRCRHRVESVEPTGIGNKLWPFGFEHLPDCLFTQFRMPVRLGVSDALVQQPCVQLGEGFEPQPWREESAPGRAQPGSRPVPSPSLMPACRRPGRRGNGYTSA